LAALPAPALGWGPSRIEPGFKQASIHYHHKTEKDFRKAAVGELRHRGDAAHKAVTHIAKGKVEGKIVVRMS
jgi:hypothetical protein